jgi:hypothetical protein
MFMTLRRLFNTLFDQGVQLKSDWPGAVYGKPNSYLPREHSAGEADLQSAEVLFGRRCGRNTGANGVHPV